MKIKGIVKDGVVVLEDGATLAEGTLVEVITPDEELQSLADVLRPVIGAAGELPEDLSVNHDHHEYGQPQKGQAMKAGFEVMMTR